MLSSRDDLETVRARFRDTGRAVLPNFLDPSFARSVVEGVAELNCRQLWFQANRGDAWTAADPCAPRWREFAFRFEQYPIAGIPLRSLVGAGVFSSRSDIHRGMSEESASQLHARSEAPWEELAPTNALRSLSSLLRTAEMAELVRVATGLPVAAGHVTAFLSRYRSGDFLTPHTDEESNRLCAFVLNLTDGWRPHWGGHLLFLEEAGGTAEAVLPTFNELVIFKTPKLHTVTGVMSPCPAARIACSGWFLTGNGDANGGI